MGSCCDKQDQTFIGEQYQSEKITHIQDSTGQDIESISRRYTSIGDSLLMTAPSVDLSYIPKSKVSFEKLIIQQTPASKLLVVNYQDNLKDNIEGEEYALDQYTLDAYLQQQNE
ncbi:Hypothetical_protein [Hexamita inflata]|uniref:Hypothetical_protein n=1 Tax=Hexamita inflata TaxID=28002 RepID=A0AA86U8S8_9EUKA|nr:Hypothetical protein HINF_LOCUS30961 [Hexamita inflata]